MTVEFFYQNEMLPYSQYNSLMSLISQVLIDQYLIHSVHPTFLLGRGEWVSYQLFKEEEALFLEGIAGKAGVVFFMRKAVFT